MADWGDAPGVGRTRASVWRHGSGNALDALPKGKPRRFSPWVKRTMSWREVSSRSCDRRGSGLAPEASGTRRTGWDEERRCESPIRAQPPQQRGTGKSIGHCARRCGSGDRDDSGSSSTTKLVLIGRGASPGGRLPFPVARPTRRTPPASSRDRLRYSTVGSGSTTPCALRRMLNTPSLTVSAAAPETGVNGN